MRKLKTILPYLLVAHASVLAIWGALGGVEYFVPGANFGLQNPNFPMGVQFLHWLLIFTTGAMFVLGFVLRWRHLAQATIIMYATLATLCFVETVDFDAFGGGPTRFIPMSIEFSMYILFSIYLTHSTTFRRRFAQEALT